MLHATLYSVKPGSLLTRNLFSCSFIKRNSFKMTKSAVCLMISFWCFVVPGKRRAYGQMVVRFCFSLILPFAFTFAIQVIYCTTQK